jgi:plasmid stabilization system protein ParE
MRVKLSKEARQDIDRQITYLSGKTISGIVTFRAVIKRAERLLSSQPHAGQADTRIPIRGAMRIIIDGWHFDYDIIDGTVWVQRITSSVNTPSPKYDDDFDYEKLGRTLSDDSDQRRMLKSPRESLRQP